MRMTLEQAKIIRRLQRACTKALKERGGTEHNSYHALEEVLTKYQKEADKVLKTRTKRT